MIVSLTVTPMICAWLPDFKSRNRSSFDHFIENSLDKISDLYGRSLHPVVGHPWKTLAVLILTIIATVELYKTIPKGNLPQDDIGLINGTTEAAPDVSFAEMSRLQRSASDTLMLDPDVADVGSFIGATGLTSSQNQGRLFVSNQPARENQIVGKLLHDFAQNLQKLPA